MKYQLLALGGTFDHLHRGHEAFLLHAFRLSARVSIGVTSDAMVQDKPLPRVIEPFAQRKKAVEDFLRKRGLLDRASLKTLHDVYGITVVHPTLEAILVTRETLANARRINLERRKRGQKKLAIELMPFINGMDKKPINSTRIRMGEEDREGRIFYSKTLGLFNRAATEEARTFLKRPFGRLVVGTGREMSLAAKEVAACRDWHNGTIRIAVGDAATASLLAIDQRPDLSIVDFHIRRKQTYRSIGELGFTPKVIVKQVVNRKSTVSYALFQAIRHSFGRLVKNMDDHFAIRVIGEEDLAVLPAVLLAPLGSIVVYGQPPLAEKEAREGLVLVIVTEEKKQEIIRLLQSFEKMAVGKKRGRFGVDSNKN